MFVDLLLGVWGIFRELAIVDSYTLRILEVYLLIRMMLFCGLYGGYHSCLPIGLFMKMTNTASSPPNAVQQRDACLLAARNPNPMHTDVYHIEHSSTI